MKEYDFLEIEAKKIYVVLTEGAVERVILGEAEWAGYREENEVCRDVAACSVALGQLKEYFSGLRKSFSVPLKLSGAEFSRRVLQEVSRIPYGEVRSYQDVAAALGNAKACRAVGMANRNNPLPIFVPCHRVIGKNGKLVGYRNFGVEFKRYLLELERSNE